LRKAVPISPDAPVNNMRGIPSLILAVRNKYRAVAAMRQAITRNTHHRHTPRKRGIQYAAAFRLNHERWWNTGSSAFADDDTISWRRLAAVEWQ
jgi:hypothetical protein